jgi:predicted nucleic acid-binding protein
VLRAFVASDRVEVDRPDVEAGLAYLSRGPDFADAVILRHAEQSRVDRLVTFDRDFAGVSRSSAVEVILPA